MARAVFMLIYEDSSDNISSEPYENLKGAKRGARNIMGDNWPTWAEWKSVGRGHWAIDVGSRIFSIKKQKV